MPDKRVLIRHIAEMEGMPTAHGLGYKKVLIGGDDTDTPITQIAYTMLSMGDVVETHQHPTMDEHFIILEGMCNMIFDGEKCVIESGTYLYVPAGTAHSIEVVEPLTLITIGVATE